MRTLSEIIKYNQFINQQSYWTDNINFAELKQIYLWSLANLVEFNYNYDNKNMKHLVPPMNNELV